MEVKFCNQGLKNAQREVIDLRDRIAALSPERMRAAAQAAELAAEPERAALGRLMEAGFSDPAIVKRAEELSRKREPVSHDYAIGELGKRLEAAMAKASSFPFTPGDRLVASLLRKAPEDLTIGERAIEIVGEVVRCFDGTLLNWVNPGSKAAAPRVAFVDHERDEPESASTWNGVGAR